MYCTGSDFTLTFSIDLRTGRCCLKPVGGWEHGLRLERLSWDHGSSLDCCCCCWELLISSKLKLRLILALSNPSKSESRISKSVGVVISRLSLIYASKFSVLFDIGSREREVTAIWQEDVANKQATTRTGAVDADRRIY